MWFGVGAARRQRADPPRRAHATSRNIPCCTPTWATRWTSAPTCTVGHHAILHGCTVGEGALIGMGATVLNGARIGRGSLVGANALVTEGKEFPGVLPDRRLAGPRHPHARRSRGRAAAATAAHYVDNWRRFAGRLGSARAPDGTLPKDRMQGWTTPRPRTSPRSGARGRPSQPLVAGDDEGAGGGLAELDPHVGVLLRLALDEAVAGGLQARMREVLLSSTKSPRSVTTVSTAWPAPVSSRTTVISSAWRGKPSRISMRRFSSAISSQSPLPSSG